LKTNILSVILPNQKRKCLRRNAERGNRQDTLLQTDILNKATAKRKLKMDKEANAKSIPDKKKGRASNVKVVFPDLHEDSDENTSCGFCGSYYSVYYVQKCDWIRCQKCYTWYDEVCVGAVGRKQFICEKCL
jgi:hypothetical protein